MILCRRPKWCLTPTRRRREEEEDDDDNSEEVKANKKTEEIPGFRPLRTAVAAGEKRLREMASKDFPVKRSGR